ncbi:MAG: hypothetical protein MJ198_04500 [Bacteroidales bacterium]|nr:hypothetical protein [Bacteroidales bacterium]
MILVFCLSNLHVPATLAVISQTEENVCIYTDQQTLVDFFSKLQLPQVEILYVKPEFKKHYNRLVAVCKILYTLLYRRYSILKSLKGRKIKQIYFFHETFGTMELWLISKLSRNSDCYYCPVLQYSDSKEEIQETFKSKLLRKYEKICWGVDRRVVDYGKKRYVFTEKYLEQNAIQTRDVPNVLSTSIKDKIYSLYSTKKKIVILVEDVSSIQTIPSDVYFTYLNEIIKKLGRENVVLKNHPRYPIELKNYIVGDFEEMPGFLPLNLYLDTFSAVIGNWSSVLFEVHENTKSVSLLKIFRKYYNSAELYEGHIRYLLDNDKKSYIWYPESIDDFCASLQN